MGPASDPYTILGIAMGASADVIKKAYRARAKQLHPDVSAASGHNPVEAARKFRELVAAFETLSKLAPDSMENHPLWPKLSELDRYWARELGYIKADEFEEWLAATHPDYFEEEEASLGEGSAPEEDERATGNPTAAVGREQAPTEGADEQQGGAAARITALLGFRIFLGNEQWRVRWAAASDSHAAEEPEESWEVYSVLQTEPLRREAIRLRDAEIPPTSHE
eukprot:5110584-Prymnesium_polylepis.1